MSERVYNARKTAYKAKLENLLDSYKNIMVISADNVGSNQMQQVRIALRGRAVILMGKNTIMRKVLRERAAENPQYEPLLAAIVGNMGFVFTDSDLNEVREVIQSNKVPAAARAGAFAPQGVVIPPGPTGLDPGQTSFFQALNIATKIIRGSIEILNPVNLINKGERVSASATALLGKLKIKPFFFGIVVTHVYEDGTMYDAAVLDLGEAEMKEKFFAGVSALASLALAINYPTAASVPHVLTNSFKVLVALSLATEYTFEAAQPFKDYLADPAAYMAANGGGAAPAAAAAGGAAPAAAAVEEEESEDDEPAAGLFDDDDDY